MARFALVDLYFTMIHAIQRPAVCKDSIQRYASDFIRSYLLSEYACHQNYFATVKHIHFILSRALSSSSADVVTTSACHNSSAGHLRMDKTSTFWQVCVCLCLCCSWLSLKHLVGLACDLLPSAFLLLCFVYSVAMLSSIYSFTAVVYLTLWSIYYTVLSFVHVLFVSVVQCC